LLLPPLVQLTSPPRQAGTNDRSAALPQEWSAYLVPGFDLARFPSGSQVLDVGFGHGEQLRHLQAAGCRAFGLEFDRSLAARGREAGLAVCRARAECLPFATGSLDGIICKVVVPYTDEAVAIGEIARVLRPGGIARLLYHGSGYFLKYLAEGEGWKRRLYGARTIVNTMVYRATGRRLPGFWGDTLLQSRRRLACYYRRCGLELLDDRPARRFWGRPVFIYHEVRKGQANPEPRTGTLNPEP
jgi:SAM-dependent methyltransferase